MKVLGEFGVLREKYRRLVQRLIQDYPRLGAWEQELVDRREGPSYRVETPVVYNEALDEIKNPRDIRLILAADNPGRREQSSENRRYLVGPSGKIAEKFFRERPELGIDFRKNVLILNKTPIHTPRTAELAVLCRLGGERVRAAVEESQRAMAALLLEFHRLLAPLPVWIIGYSEMKKGGVFETYTTCLQNAYRRLASRRKEIFLFRHFSMNQFTSDIKSRALPDETCGESLERIGGAYRERILGL
jgi:hypothetical protein